MTRAVWFDEAERKAAKHNKTAPLKPWAKTTQNIFRKKLCMLLLPFGDIHL